MKNYPPPHAGEQTVLRLTIPSARRDVGAERIVDTLAVDGDTEKACENILDSIALSSALGRFVPYGMKLEFDEAADSIYIVDSDGRRRCTVYGASMSATSTAAHFAGALSAYRLVSELLKMGDRLAAIIEKRDDAENPNDVLGDWAEIGEDAMTHMIDSVLYPDWAEPDKEDK